MYNPEKTKTVTETTVPLRANAPISVKIETGDGKEFSANIQVCGEDLKKVAIKAKRPKEHTTTEEASIRTADKLYDRYVGNDLRRYRMFINNATRKLVKDLNKLLSSIGEDSHTLVEDELDKLRHEP